MVSLLGIVLLSKGIVSPYARVEGCMVCLCMWRNRLLDRTSDYDVYCRVHVHAMLGLLLPSQSSWPLENAQIHQEASGESAAPRELFHMRICRRKLTLSFLQSSE